MPKELAVADNVYSYTFSNEINSAGSFQDIEDCQQDLFYWSVREDIFFIKELVCLHSMNGKINS